MALRVCVFSRTLEQLLASHHKVKQVRRWTPIHKLAGESTGKDGDEAWNIVVASCADVNALDSYGITDQTLKVQPLHITAYACVSHVVTSCTPHNGCDATGRCDAALCSASKAPAACQGAAGQGC